MTISTKDRARLRYLAAQQAELAASPRNQSLLKDWLAYGAHTPNPRPMIRIELGTFAPDILPPLQQCEGEDARRIEAQMLSPYANFTLFEDDTLMPDHFAIRPQRRFLPFGLPVKREQTDGVGHHFIPYLHDLDEDFPLLKPSEFGYDNQATNAYQSLIEELLGDLLPVRQTGGCLVSCPTQDIIHIMDMEDMYVAMYASPERFHDMMAKLTDDYIAYFTMLEREEQLLSAAHMQHLNQGTYCFTNTLPDNKPQALLKDCWLYMDSQETSGVSPAMFESFIFPYYQRIMSLFGAVSYGCCEAVHALWDNCLAKVDNLEKVSISPWCDEAAMGERLQGTEITYLRKPPATILGVPGPLDEAMARDSFRKTAQAAKGCRLELAQRDVYQIHGTSEKVRRYVQLAREALER